eukprot:2162431-Karenia_brevis.AAC.1
MLDRHGVQGAQLAGFMPQLESVLGAGYFDDGFESTRFATLLQSTVRMASQLRAVWQDLQTEVGVAGGILA